jgi:TRAP-type C4-dicarboxylate transport system substrate-binding protein
MQHFKSFSTILMAVVLTIGILGSATTSQAKNWKSGHPAPPGTPFDVAHQKFIDLVKEKTDGKIIIDGFPAEQLGPYRDMFSNVVLGVQEMGFLPASPEFSPVLQAITTTYIADNWEDVREITRPGGWMFNMLEPVFDKLGIKMLGILPCGFEGFANIKGPVLTPEDITKKNIKVRTWCPADRLMFEGMGAQTVDVSFSELFTSIQTGVAHAHDSTPLISYFMFKDVTKYYTDINHIFETLIVMVNKKKYNKLSVAHQKALQEAANEAVTFGADIVQQAEESIFKKMEEEGIQVIRLTPEQRSAWKAYGRKSWDVFQNILGKDAMDHVRAHAN